MILNLMLGAKAGGLEQAALDYAEALRLAGLDSITITPPDAWVNRALDEVGIRHQSLKQFGGWDPRGKTWIIEGRGVDPDVDLDLGPDGFLGGKDAQIDFAVDLLMKKIAKEPRTLPAPPPVIPRPLRPVN